MSRRIVPVVTGLGIVLTSLGFVLLAPARDLPAAGQDDPVDVEFHRPRPLGDFVVSRLDGGEIGSLDLRGRVSLIDVWAPWCAPCLTEIPELNRLGAEYGDGDVAVVGVAMRSGSAEDVREAIVSQGLRFDYPVTVGNAGFEEATRKIWALPTTYLIDADGRIVRTWIGRVPGKARQIKELVERLLAGESPGPPTAG